MNAEGETMKLNEHPKVRPWPPSPGTWHMGTMRILLPGEGKLRDVRWIVACDPDPAYLQVEIEHEESAGNAPLFVDEPELLKTVYQKLYANIGRPILDVGQIELC